MIFKTFLSQTARIFTVLYFFAGFSVLFLSCKGGNKNTTAGVIGAPEKGDWIVIHELSDSEGLNPYTTNDASSRDIYVKIFESMLDLDWKTAELQPHLVTEMPVVSEDHLSFTFKLRKDVIFSDGHPLTAKDVVFSTKAVKNPLVVDAAALRNYYEDLKDVVALDDYTVKFTMGKPYFLALYYLGQQLYVLPKHVFDPENLTDQYTIEETNNLDKAANQPAMKKFAEWFGGSERKRDPKFMIGTGPYIFEEWRTNEYIRLRRNDKYWNAQNDPSRQNYPEKLVFKTVNDRPSAVSALKNQDLDFINYIPPMLFDEIDTNVTKHIKKDVYLIPSYVYVCWNMRHAIFADKYTRQGLSHLFDRTSLIKTVMRGYAVPTNSTIFPEAPEYDKTLKNYDFNPEEAKKLFAQAGWSDSNGDGILDKMIDGKRVDFKFTILLNAGNEIRENIALLLSDEAKKVGVKVELQRLEWSVFLENVKSSQFDAIIGAWVEDPTPPDLYQLWHSSQADNKGSNYPGFKNKRVDELIEKNRVEFDRQKRIDYMREVQQIMSDEQPYTFLWVVKWPAGYHNRIQNVQFYPVRPGYNVNNFWVPRSMQKFPSPS